MNFLNNRSILRELLRQGDLMNTIYGGVSETSFKVEKVGEDLVVKVSNPSVSPNAFNFIVKGDELLINIMAKEKSSVEGKEPMMYPMFFKAIKIPYYIDLSGIEATYQDGEFKVFLPYNNKIPNRPFKINVRNRDN